MATKHHVVGHPGKLSAEQLARIQDDYERDLALAPKAEPTKKKAAKSGESQDDKGDSTEK